MGKIKQMISKYNELFFGYDKDIYTTLSPVTYIKSNSDNGYRINLVVPNLNSAKYFGGIATALRFAAALADKMNARIRVIGEELFDTSNMPQFKEYEFFYADDENTNKRVVSKYRDSAGKKICVEKNDIFIMTYWTTMYKYKTVYDFQKETFGYGNDIIYLIQDFEPSFFKWSAYYLLAESTYKEDHTIAVFNTEGLMKYTNRLGYRFTKQFYFEPQLNGTMRDRLFQKDNIKRKNKLIIYGRPRNARNCFPLIIEALKRVVEKSDEAKEWEFISIGIKHKNWNLGNGVMLRSEGKLPLDKYCEILKEAKVGVSLMCSPHPSYPPLEMAAYGVHTITNGFVDKGINGSTNNLIVLDKITIESLADTILEQIENYHNSDTVIDNKFEVFIQKENVEFLTLIPDLIRCYYRD